MGKYYVKIYPLHILYSPHPMFFLIIIEKINQKSGELLCQIIKIEIV